MVVITLEKCPPALRGDLTKWLQEISLGVYVGQVSARVRDNLWARVCSEAKNGRATMVFSAQNEQHLDFRVHNTSWIPVDFDGLKLMLRPSDADQQGCNVRREGFSNAFKHRKTRQSSSKKVVRTIDEYVVVDLETTGLAPSKDEIIEVAALKVEAGHECGEFQTLVRAKRAVPDTVSRLTGLTDEMISKGEELETAMDGFLAFVGTSPMVMHNAEFDMAFIDAALDSLDIDELDNECIDTLALARKKLPYATSHNLDDLAQLLSIEGADRHRAMGDCMITKELFEIMMAM